MLEMLARQACRQHAVIGNALRAEITKNSLNLCDFSKNSRNRNKILHRVMLHQRFRHDIQTTAAVYTSHCLDIPLVRLSTVDWPAFPVSGATVWNDLYFYVASAPSLAVFIQLLKTSVRRRGKNVDSSSKSNPLRRRGKNYDAST